MRREKLTGTVKEIISKILKCDKKKVFVKSELVKDFGADSMNILQIIIAIERELILRSMMSVLVMFLVS